MEDLNIKITLIKFLWIALTTIGVYALFHLVLNFLINQMRSAGSDQKKIRRIEALRRIFIIVLIIILLVSFILLNPVVNLILLAFLTYVGGDTLKNVILGTALDQEFSLIQGKSYKTGNHEGILTHQGWTGIKLSTKGNVIFIPYRLLFDQGIKINEKESSFIVVLIGEMPEGKSKKQVLEEINSILFPLPYLIDVNLPIIKIDDNSILIEVGLINTSYLQSLIDHLKNNHFETQVLKKK